MTFARFLVLWASTSFVVALLVGRAIAMGRLKGKPCHLLTARQVAAEVGVSLAAVQSWLDEGLIPTIACAGCPGTIPVDVLARLRAPESAYEDIDRRLAAGWRPEGSDVDDVVARLRSQISAERRGAETGGWAAMSRSRWPS